MPEENALVPYYGSTFPLLPQDELFRDSAVSTVLGLLESNFDVVFVEGQTGIGKTVLLSQIFRHTKPNSFGIFIKNLSRWSCDPRIPGQGFANAIRTAAARRRSEQAGGRNF